MRILVVGSGGVGDAVARIAVDRDFFELMVVADYDRGPCPGDGRGGDGPHDG